jgi:hypothetical protein
LADGGQTSPETAKPAVGLRVVSSGDFVREYVPLDPLLDGVLQMSFLYSLTGKTGDGKTTVLLLLAACIADRRLFAGRSCEHGPVFILAGENPDDVRMRWIGLTHSFGIDPDSLDVHFIPGVFTFPQLIRLRSGRSAARSPEWEKACPPGSSPGSAGRSAVARSLVPGIRVE